MKNYAVYKLLEFNYNQTKSTPKNMFKMCDFWMYSINLGVLIDQGAFLFIPVVKQKNGTYF